MNLAGNRRTVTQDMDVRFKVTIKSGTCGKDTKKQKVVLDTLISGR
jgi:hypothetical protein